MGELTDLGSELQGFFDRGIRAVSDDEVRRWEAEQEAEERRGRLEASGVAERMTSEDLAMVLEDRLKPTRSLELVRGWMLSTRPALVLMGKPGLGKTIAAAWALARRSGRYISAPLLSDLHHGRGIQRQHYEAHRTCGLLVIDEVGLERDAAEASATMADIVDSRMRARRRTLLMSNLTTAAKWVERYDERTLDRLGIHGDEDGVALFRTVNGTSMRRKGGGVDAP